MLGKSIILIIPYFGKWPIWFDAYLTSVAANPTVNWLCPTDCEIPKQSPENIKFLPTTLEQLNVHVNKVVDACVPLTPRKFCDLKPAYGELFAEEVQGYDFWGFCDMDIVWGNIRKFITDDILNKYDIISSREENISGHFTLFRNNEKINSLYKKLANYRLLFEYPKFQWTDEVVLSNYIKTEIEKGVFPYRVYWPMNLLNEERGRDSHQEYHLDKWLWKEGKMFRLKRGEILEEVMYLHFINWKRTMKYSMVKYKDNPSQFYISYLTLHYQLHSSTENAINVIKNLFNGYWINEKRRIRKNKFQSFKRRIIKKLKFIF